MRTHLVIALVCGLAAAGCASKVLQVRENREAPAGLAAGERIAILLLSYEDEGVVVAGAHNEQALAWVEERLESCVQRAMAERNSSLAFASARDARAALFPGKSISELPREPADWLRAAGEAGFGERAASLRVRYAVALQSRWTTGPGRASGGQGVISRDWDRYSHLNATVLDLAHRRIAGTVGASAKGGAGWAVVLVVPLFYVTDPEDRACSALGEALARLIAE